jgi:hypothetical protein
MAILGTNEGSIMLKLVLLLKICPQYAIKPLMDGWLIDDALKVIERSIKRC